MPIERTIPFDVAYAPFLALRDAEEYDLWRADLVLMTTTGVVITMRFRHYDLIGKMTADLQCNGGTAGSLFIWESASNDIKIESPAGATRVRPVYLSLERLARWPK